MGCVPTNQEQQCVRSAMPALQGCKYALDDDHTDAVAPSPDSTGKLPNPTTRVRRDTGWDLAIWLNHVYK